MIELILIYLVSSLITFLALSIPLKAILMIKRFFVLLHDIGLNTFSKKSNFNYKK